MRIMFNSNELDDTSTAVMEITEAYVSSKISIKSSYNATQSVNCPVLVFSNSMTKQTVYLVGRQSNYQQLCRLLGTEGFVNLTGFDGVYWNPTEEDLRRIMAIAERESNSGNDLMAAAGLAAPLR